MMNASSDQPVEPRESGAAKAAARWISRSALFAKARQLHDGNVANWNMAMGKLDKLQLGVYMILRDYAAGIFPPVFADQQKAYQAEMDKLKNLQGTTLERQQAAELRKPFWGSKAYSRYSRDYVRLWRLFEGLGLRPSSRLLELGCGAGWMAEFFGLAGYAVVGTSIAPDEVAMAQKRVDALAVKGAGGRVSFAVSPMEAVDAVVDGSFDAVFVYEALHHAFDWRQAVGAAHRCLKPGGWFVLASEPNVLHTFIAYRAARLSNTHEIGFSRRDLKAGLAARGFTDIRCVAPRLNNLISQHWIIARK